MDMANENAYFNEYFENDEEFFNDTNNSIPQDFADMTTLHSDTHCTLHDAFLMIYAYSIRHDLSWTATEDLIRLINKIIGQEKVPASKHIFEKKFSSKAGSTVTHFYCHECGLYLGTHDEIKDTTYQCCQNCQTKIQTDTKYKKNHFISIPFRNHLEKILEKNSDHLSFDFCSPTTGICDVHDSIYFQHLRNSMEDTFITLTLSTDGAVVFKATKDKSLWPLQFIINEIDKNHRFRRENIFCSTIAFGKTPNMQVFMKPFIEEINQINADGGLSFTMKSGERKTVKIYPMIFTGDIIAKQYVLNKSSFHGYMGCSYCLHKGTLVNGQVYYCKRDNAPARTNDKSRADMLAAHASQKRINGYNGVSALMAFQNFDVVWQAVIDKMHNIDIGVTKKLFGLFLDSKNSKER